MHAAGVGVAIGERPEDAEWKRQGHGLDVGAFAHRLAAPFAAFQDMTPEQQLVSRGRPMLGPTGMGAVTTVLTVWKVAFGVVAMTLDSQPVGRWIETGHQQLVVSSPGGTPGAVGSGSCGGRFDVGQLYCVQVVGGVVRVKPCQQMPQTTATAFHSLLLLPRLGPHR